MGSEVMNRWIVDYQRELYAFYGTDVGKLVQEYERALAASEGIEIRFAEGGNPLMSKVREVNARVQAARIALFNHLGAKLPPSPTGAKDNG